MLGQGIATLLGKPADLEDAGRASQRTIAPELEFRLLLYSKGKGCGLLLQTSLVPESFVLAAVQVGLVTMFL